MQIDTKKWLTDISRHPEEVEREYDGISHSYDAELEAKGYLAHKHAATLIASHIPNRKSRLLEAGCGTGLVGQELAKRGFSNVTGMDISALCLKEADAKGVYIGTVKHNLLERFPFADGGFDAIVCVGVFSRFDVTRIKGIVTEFARVVKEEGKIIFSHREDLITSALHEVLDGIEAIEIEEVTAPLPYFSMDEHYKDIDIRFFILEKRIGSPKD
uniref:Methyltransferase domain-containing protein n=1 Tax=Candidatus Kentrum sp. SD TaxID=2126332 RepID=A0A450YP11_9GAMM|nr:MAG: Methyltransferase domain-containing protein [Candidatus Kentron sp. SD]VFK43287.1 MAG: Methyltransferase domain-containing protein [Candidatus Kentron sp. SD]